MVLLRAFTRTVPCKLFRCRRCKFGSRAKHVSLGRTHDCCVYDIGSRLAIICRLLRPLLFFMKMSLFYDYYGIGVKVISSMSFWMYWPLCLAICLTVELLIIAYRKMFSPNPEDILREFECGVAEVPGHPLNKSDNKKRKKSRLRPFSVSDLGNTESVNPNTLSSWTDLRK